MTDKRRSIADLLILTPVTEIDMIVLSAVDLVPNTLIDHIGLVIVSHVKHDTSLRSSTQKLT